MSRIPLRGLEEAQAGDVGSVRALYQQLASRLDSLTPEEAALLRAALLHLGEGGTAQTAFMPGGTAQRGAKSSRPAVAYRNSLAMFQRFEELVDSGMEEPQAKAAVAIEFGRDLATVQRAVKAVREVLATIEEDNAREWQPDVRATVQTIPDEDRERLEHLARLQLERDLTPEDLAEADRLFGATKSP